MKHLRLIATSVVLLHALLTGPLLVECIPSDGKYLVEILGHDPCRPLHEENRTSYVRWFQTTTVALLYEKTDPCRDSIIDSYCDRSICSDLLMRALQAHEEEARTRHLGAQIVLRAEILCRGLGPVVPDNRTARSPAVLRI